MSSAASKVWSPGRLRTAILFAAGSAVMAIFVVFQTDAAQLVGKQLLALSGFVLVAFLCLWLGTFAGSKGRDLFDPGILIPTLYLLHYGVFALPLIFQQRSLEAIAWRIDVRAYFTEVMLAAALSVAGFTAGYLAPWGQWLASRLPKLRAAPDRRRMLIVIGTFAIVGVFAYLYFIISLGGFSFLLANMGRRATLVADEGKVGLGYFFWLSRVLIVVPPLLVVYAKAAKEKLGLRRQVLVLGAALFIMALLTVLGGRGAAMQPLLLVVLVVHYLIKQIRIHHLLLLVGAFIVYGVMVGEFRSKGTTKNVEVFDTAKLVKAMPKIPTIAYVYSIFQDGDHNLLYGKSLLATFEPVLGKIWPSYRYPSAGMYLGQLIGFQKRGAGGPTPTLVGEMMMNFSWAGVLFGFLFCGMTARLLYSWLLLEGDNALVVVAYVVMMLMFVHNVIFHGGYSASIFKGSTVAIWAVLAVRLCTPKKGGRWTSA